jgi:hypothetical protein
LHSDGVYIFELSISYCTKYRNTLIASYVINILHFLGIGPLRCVQEFTFAKDVGVDHFDVSPIQLVSPSIVLSACIRPVCTEKTKAFNLQASSCLDPVAFTNN